MPRSCAPRRPDRPRRLGHPRRARQQRDRAGAHAGLRRCWRGIRTRSSIASGEAVGLPAGQMGNSEVGHTNMGAGRVVYQDLTRIDKSIRDGEFFENAGAARGDGSLRRRRPCAAPHRPAVGRRRPQPPAPPARADRDGRRRARAPRLRARHHRRPRHLADRRRQVHRRSSRSEMRRVGVGRIATVIGPLLRHGPRQALGAHASSPTTRWCTARRTSSATSARQPIERLVRGRRHRRVHRAASSSSAPTASRSGRSGRRFGRLLQLPRRSRAAADAALIALDDFDGFDRARTGPRSLRRR